MNTMRVIYSNNRREKRRTAQIRELKAEIQRLKWELVCCQKELEKARKEVR